MTATELQPANMEQLALALYEDATANNLSIRQIAPEHDITFRKPQELMNARVDDGDLSLTAKKALNVLHYLASTEGGSPEWFDYDLGFVRWLLNFNSRNQAYLNETLRTTQKASVVINVIDPNSPGKDNYLSVPLMGTVGVRNGRVRFKLEPALHGVLKDPLKASVLSLRVQAYFSSQYAHDLYERILHLTEHGGSTEWMTPEEFTVWLKVTTKAGREEFRYLRRDVIDPAISQINESKRLTVELDLDRGARGKVTRLRFIVKPGGVLPSASIERERALYESLTTEFGLSKKDMQEVGSWRDEFPDFLERVGNAVDAARHRITDKRQEPVLQPRALVKKMIREGARLGSLDLLLVAPPKSPAAATAQSAAESGEQLRLSMNQDKTAGVALEAYEERASANPSEAEEMWRAFTTSIVGKTTGKKVDLSDRNSALQDPKVRLSFGNYLAQKAKNRAVPNS